MENIKLQNDLEVVLGNFPESETVKEYKRRASEGSLTIQENPASHLCAYFAAYDPGAKKVFIGHHKKSGLWLFNGGHIDAGETIRETLVREIDEEWGLNASDFKIGDPALLTITEIENPAKQTCKRHYDIWLFIDVDQAGFQPAPSRLLAEFHEAGWKSYEESMELVKDRTTISGIEFIAKHYFSREGGAKLK